MGFSPKVIFKRSLREFDPHSRPAPVVNGGKKSVIKPVWRLSLLNNDWRNRVMMTGISRQLVVSKLPEIREIGNAQLRETVERIWVRALKESPWDDVDHIPFSPEGPEHLRKYSLIDHTRCVTKTAIALADNLRTIHNLKINLDNVIAGALLHDVGKAMVFEKRGKSIVISEKGKQLTHILLGSALAIDEGLPDDLVHIVFAHTIPYMTLKQPVVPKSLEGVIVHYADFASGDSLFFVGNVALLCNSAAEMWSKSS